MSYADNRTFFLTVYTGQPADHDGKRGSGIAGEQTQRTTGTVQRTFNGDEKTMSHITSVKTKIALKNEGMLKNAIRAMQGQFQGMTFEQVNPNLIQVRYAPIETFQNNGNLQFIKNPVTGAWEMHCDYYACRKDMEAVRDAFFVQYQQAAVSSFLSMNGYMTSTQKDGKNIVLTASKY